MRIKVIVDAPEDRDKWLAHQKKDVVVQPEPEVKAALAQCLLATACAACSQRAPVVRTRRSEPDLTHLASRTTLFADLKDFSVEHIKTWLRDPRSMKAGSGCRVLSRSMRRLIRRLRMTPYAGSIRS